MKIVILDPISFNRYLQTYLLPINGAWVMWVPHVDVSFCDSVAKLIGYVRAQAEHNEWYSSIINRRTPRTIVSLELYIVPHGLTASMCRVDDTTTIAVADTDELIGVVVWELSNLK